MNGAVPAWDTSGPNKDVFHWVQTDCSPFRASCAFSPLAAPRRAPRLLWESRRGLVEGRTRAARLADEPARAPSPLALLEPRLGWGRRVQWGPAPLPCFRGDTLPEGKSLPFSEPWSPSVETRRLRGAAQVSRVCLQVCVRVLRVPMSLRKEMCHAEGFRAGGLGCFDGKPSGRPNKRRF